MNSLRFTKIASAVALACATGSALATALTTAIDASTYNEASANQITLKIAGSSAMDPGVERLFQVQFASGGELCAPGTLSEYRSSDSNYRLFMCTVSTHQASGIAGKTLAVLKTSSGGSGKGVGSLIRSTEKATIWATSTATNITTTVAGCAVTSTPPSSTNFASYNLHDSCTASTESINADVGLSDEEPQVFQTIFASGKLSNSELAAIPGAAFGLTVFGVPVTLGIYERLQAMQFPTSNVCNPQNASYSTNQATDACMPNLKRSTIAGLYSGQIDFSNLVADGTGQVAKGTSLDQVTIAANSSNGNTVAARSALSTPTMKLESRTSTSGTLALFETYFLGERCSTGGVTIKKAPDTSVTENSNSTNVALALDTDDKATTEVGAMGILTTEITPGSQNWRFVKVDGAAPTLINVNNGSYQFFAEGTMQYRTATVGGLSTLATANANGKTVALAMQSLYGNPNVQNDLNVAFRQTFGDAGLMSPTSSGNTLPTPPFVTDGVGGTGDLRTFPVATVTRGAAGAPVTCSAPSAVGSVSGSL